MTNTGAAMTVDGSGSAEVCKGLESRNAGVFIYPSDEQATGPILCQEQIDNRWTFIVRGQSAAGDPNLFDPCQMLELPY